MHLHRAAIRRGLVADVNAHDGQIPRRIDGAGEADLMPRQADGLTDAGRPGHVRHSCNEIEQECSAAPEAACDRPERTCKVRPYRQIIDGLVAACDHVNATRQRQRADILLQQQHRTSRQPPARTRNNGTRAIDANETDRQAAQFREKASGAAAHIGEGAKFQTVQTLSRNARCSAEYAGSPMRKS